MSNRESFSTEDAMKALNNVSDDAPIAADPNDREGPFDDEEEEDSVEAGAEDGATDDDQDESEVDASATDDEEDEAGPDKQTTDEVDADEEQAEPAKQTIEPPQYLDAQEREAFKALPPKAQEILARQSKLLQSDYSRKQGEIATQRKQLDNRLKSLAGVRTELEARVEKWKKIDWKKAALTMDPKKYQANLAARDEDFEKLRNVRTEQDKHEQADWSNHVIRERKELETKFPHLAGEANKSKREEVYAAAKAAGVPDDRARWIGAEEMAMVYDALQWRKYQAEKKKTPLSKKTVSAAKTPGKKTQPASRSTNTNNPSASQAGRQLASFRKAPTVAGARSALDALDVD